MWNPGVRRDLRSKEDALQLSVGQSGQSVLQLPSKQTSQVAHVKTPGRERVASLRIIAASLLAGFGLRICKCFASKVVLNMLTPATLAALFDRSRPRRAHRLGRVRQTSEAFQHPTNNLHVLMLALCKSTDD